MASEKQKDDDNESEEEVFTPSELDELSHAELRMLYAESTETLRFVKSLQWKTVGSTLLAFMGMIVIARIIDANKPLTDKFMAISLLLTLASIFTLILYQFWQANEHAKINSMNARFSTLYRTVRAHKSSLEANIHRYTLLAFMMLTIILGATVTHLALTRIAFT